MKSLNNLRKLCLIKVKKWGFTLAEVLITLGIIGVVAAITIPALLTNLNNRHTESILREDYSILQQMMTSANDTTVREKYKQKRA